MLNKVKTVTKYSTVKAKSGLTGPLYNQQTSGPTGRPVVRTTAAMKVLGIIDSGFKPRSARWRAGALPLSSCVR